MHLYKFRPLGKDKHLKKIKDIIENGFYCCDFLSFNDMYEGVFTVNSENINVDVSEKQKYKICSFSGNNALESQLMWGHYANAGMGVVIEVDVTGEQCGKIKEVLYGNSTFHLNTTEEILTHKSEEWKYEDEFRYLTKEQMGCKNTIKIGKITRMYFGEPYQNLINYNEIKSKHQNLIKYLKLKGTLEKFCQKKFIKYGNYEFNKMA